MAQPISCDACQAALADMLITRLADGDTTGLCLTCFLGFAEGIERVVDQARAEQEAAAVAQLDAAGTVDQLVDPESVEHAPKRGRKKEPETVEEDQAAVAETTPASDVTG